MAFTKIMEKNGKVTTFTTQQYEIGLYVIINNDPALQMRVQTPEKKFHQKIIKKAERLGATIETTI